MQKICRIGEINYNKYGSKMTIVEYKNANDLLIEFEDGYRVQNIYKNFKEGGISNPFEKSVYGVGYLGVGQYVCSKKSMQYRVWHSMLSRCYNEIELQKYPTYKDCTVCKEWHNFQVFAQWYDENYYEVDTELMHLDKDILNKGNKVYSPDTCIFVPERINTLFTKNDSKRGSYPLGVCYYKNYNCFVAGCSFYDNILKKKRRKSLGYFSTPEEAFYKGYKPFKEKHIKKMADLYKEQIPQELYDALYKYKVEITD